MGRKLGLLLILLSTVLLVSAEGAIAYSGEAAGCVYAADGTTAIDHLFGSNLAILPGEHLEDGLCIRPEEDVRLFLRCADLPEPLEHLRLTVTDDAPIFDGSLKDADWIYLGEYPAGSRTLLELHLTVPQDLSQEAARTWPRISWQLQAISAAAPQTADTAHPGPAAATGTLTGLLLAWAAHQSKQRKTQKSRK